MKGVILAGGTGSRLRPCTEVTNKHLLPVYDWPMLFYPINTLKGAGIDDICIVLGGNSVGDIVNLCGDGSRFGVRLTYKHQRNAGGIAEALSLTREFVGKELVTVILGDNIFLEPVNLMIQKYPCVVITEHKRPQNFGCVEFDPSGRIREIVEKPPKPLSKHIVTGLYLYNGKQIYDIIDTLEYSERGEMEITDLNNELNVKYGLNYLVVPENTWWDAGSVDAIYRSSRIVRKYKEAGSYQSFFPKED